MTKPIDIWLSIQAERTRQDESHPVTPKYFLHPINDPRLKDIKEAANDAKTDNDYYESLGKHSWANIMREELLEVFSEPGDTFESLTRMREEAIQGAALYVRLIETIDVRIKECAINAE